MEPILRYPCGFPKKFQRWAMFYLAVSSLAGFLALPDEDYVEPVLDSAEEEGVYKVLEAINPDIEWRILYPGDLCTGGPHGVVCDFVKDDGRWHIVELNLGSVANSGDNPPCGRNASFSPAMTDLVRLRKAFFYRCFMHETVSIPAYVWSLGDGLEELVFLENPALRGRLSPELVRLTGLRRFILTGTGIRGPLPAQIRDLKSLRQLDLSRNEFSGMIPSGIGELKELVILDLSSNQLDGTMPRQLGGLAKLAKLDLSFNRLRGSFPDSFLSLQVLELMDLSGNNLSGGIPLFLTRLRGLRYLYLSGNPIGGMVPDFWGNMGGLLSLGLSSAGLVGRIPRSLGALKSLNYLALDNNRFAGRIPRQLGDLPYIYHINLSGNSLTGLVPFSAKFIKRLGVNLKLAGNSGLCFAPEMAGPDSGKSALELCSDLSRSEPPALNK